MNILGGAKDRMLVSMHGSVLTFVKRTRPAYYMYTNMLLDLLFCKVACFFFKKKKGQSGRGHMRGAQSMGEDKKD